MEAVFQRDGAVRTQVLSHAECYQLLAAYHALIPEAPSRMFTIDSKDEEYRKKLNGEIKKVIAEHALEHLVDCRYFGSNFVSKAPGGCYLNAHQDNTIVDEATVPLAYCWVALQDMTPHNSCLTVVPGSHRWATHYRPFGDQLERGPFRDVIPLIRRLEQPLYMKAGEAVFYHARTIHGSFPNDSDKLRVATLSAVVPVEADLFFYHRIDDHRVEKFRITEDFYWNDYFVYTRPHRAESLGVLEWVPPKAFDEQSLLDAIAGDRRP